jgi:hypothetical protein
MFKESSSTDKTKMSFHIAVFVTSEKCGHCRHMRGEGILMSKAKIEKEKKPATVPGGNHYDAAFMKKLITANTDSPKYRVVNVHYNAFNPGEGVADISVFTLEPDNKTIRQTMFKNKENKTIVTVYTIGDTGKQVSTNEDDSKWEDTVKKFIPSNLPSYAYFYPTLSVFHSEAWMNSLRTGEPVFGYVNGLNTKEESPYGALPTSNPTPGDFVKFLGSFFDGSKQLLAKPETKAPKTEPKVVQAPEIQEVKTETKVIEAPKPVVRVPTKGACDKTNVRLYVKE